MSTAPLSLHLFNPHSRFRRAYWIVPRKWVTFQHTLPVPPSPFAIAVSTGA